MPEVSAELVAPREDGLELYAEPDDPQRPKVNFAETSKQLMAETRTPWPAKPGEVERYDSEYQRNGTRNLFLFCEPQVGWRHMAVTAQRTMRDFAPQRKGLVDEGYPHARRVRVVMDQLHTHQPASLYETFEPAEARRILKRWEFPLTPKHGSWLNMAEIEFSVLSRQCLDRRIPDEATLTRELRAYEARRNVAKAKIAWRFTSQKARVKLHRLYPSRLN
jgi:DDE superfamily endonuclease